VTKKRRESEVGLFETCFLLVRYAAVETKT